MNHITHIKKKSAHLGSAVVCRAPSNCLYYSDLDNVFPPFLLHNNNDRICFFASLIQKNINKTKHNLCS